MKRLSCHIILLVAIIVIPFQANAQQDLAPYYRIGSAAGSLAQVGEKVKTALTEANFEIIGEYSPGGKSTQRVIVFTRGDLRNITMAVKDRGALAAAMKVGIIKNGNRYNINLLNPDYIFHAYLRNNTTQYSILTKISNDIKTALRKTGNEMEPFGGSESIEDLEKYRYMMGMPRFSNPVELNSFNSFETGVKIIQSNLNKRTGNCQKVYELIDPNRKIAVFGVGLLNREEGEAKFLPIIGEEHLAAMPYEIILVGTKATMLHGRYRIALHWPDLTMGTFTKIMSTPGNIEKMLEALTQ